MTSDTKSKAMAWVKAVAKHANKQQAIADAKELALDEEQFPRDWVEQWHEGFPYGEQ